MNIIECYNKINGQNSLVWDTYHCHYEVIDMSASVKHGDIKSYVSLNDLLIETEYDFIDTLMECDEFNESFKNWLIEEPRITNSGENVGDGITVSLWCDDFEEYVNIRWDDILEPMKLDCYIQFIKRNI